jgi:hypothetical protein
MRTDGIWNSIGRNIMRAVSGNTVRTCTNTASSAMMPNIILEDGSPMSSF